MLASIAFSLPLVYIAPVAAAEEEAIMALDICGQGFKAGIDAVPALSEPVFTGAAFRAEASLFDAAAAFRPLIFTSLIHKPPRV